MGRYKHRDRFVAQIRNRFILSSTEMHDEANNMSNMKQITALYKDESFKEAFLANYEAAGESRQQAEIEYVAAFKTIYTNDSNGIMPNPPMFDATVDSIKRVLLSVSEQGLLLDPRKKEVAMTTTQSAGGLTTLDFILCYRGMYRLVGMSKKVLSTSVEIVYEGDHFEWKGSKIEPEYRMNLNHNKDCIMAGFCSFTMANGTIIAHLMMGEELDEIIKQAISASQAAGGNTDMWTGPWKGRSLRSRIFRSAFSIHKASLLDTKSMINALTVDDEMPSIDAFAKVLEESLSE